MKWLTRGRVSLHAMEVRVLSKKLVAASIPTPKHLRDLHLSFFSQAAPPVYISVILYYSNRDDTTAENLNLLPDRQLETALSELLTLFYPLAGRLSHDSLMVECLDQGVEFSEARVNLPLSQLLKGEIKADQLNNFVPTLLESEKTPLVAVQVNMFTCGGVAIGISASHKMMDAASLSNFVTAWATASRAGIKEVTMPFFDLASFFPARDLSWMKPRPPSGDKDKIVTKVLVFNGAAISNLKASYFDTAKCEASRVVLVTALLWGALLRATQARHGSSRLSLSIHSLNLRGKTCLPIKENAFGNFVLQLGSRLTAAQRREIGSPELVNAVRETIRNAVEECAEKVSCGDELAIMAENALKAEREDYNSEDMDVFNFASWCKFPFYEADFGWGKPTWVSSIHVGIEFICLQDTKDGEGIEAWAHLKEEDVISLEQDPEVTAHSSSLEYLHQHI